MKVHTRRNALLPTVTVTGLLMSYIITGLVVVEAILQYHGLGWFVVEPIVAKVSFPAFTYEVYPIVYTPILFGIFLVIGSIVADIV